MTLPGVSAGIGADPKNADGLPWLKLMSGSIWSGRYGRRAILAGLGLAWAGASCAAGGSQVSPAVLTQPPASTQSEAPTSPPAPDPPETQNPPAEDPSAEDPDPAETQNPSAEDQDTPVEAATIDWEELEHISFEIFEGETVELEGGRAVLSYGGESEDAYELQNRVTQGDLDGDGDDDLVAHIIEHSAGTGVFHLIVPVINDAGTPAARRPVTVGDRIVMDEISIADGLIEVSLFDRSDDDPFTVITLRKRLVIDPGGAEPEARVVAVEPIEDLPRPGPERPDIDIRFEAGATGASASGTIPFRQRQGYLVSALGGQQLTAALTAPLGVWLDVRLGDDVIASAAERSQRVEASLPATGPWRISVVSAHSQPADYQLTVEALPIGLDPAPEPEQPEAGPPVMPDDPTGPGGVVYLTFDDGPHPIYTPQVLDVLARYGARATFFVLGSLAESHPDLVERIAAEGHTLANHTWSHEDLASLPQPSFDDTVARTQAVLGQRATPCLRPPYGSTDAFTREWAAAHGLDLVLWTVDTNDWRKPGTAAIANEILTGAADGAIVLMHDGGGRRHQTVQALELALQQMSGRFRFEPVCTVEQQPDANTAL